jgi:phytanoyl-CoA hydroxylase
MQYMQEHSAFFDGLPRTDKFRQLAELLLDGDVVPKGTEWFNKPPALNKPTPPHQDGYYFMLEPNEALTMWIPTDPVDESNGCLRYLPGSHIQGVRPHSRTNTLGFSQGIVDYSDEDRRNEQPIILQPGDLVVHHSLTIHRADANESDRNRAVIGLVYYSSRAKKDEAASAAYQEKLHKELEAAGLI